MIMTKAIKGKIWVLHGCDFSDRGLLGCDAVWCWCRISTFRRALLSPSSGWSEDEGRKVLRNVAILHQHYTASQPRRPRSEFNSNNEKL